MASCCYQPCCGVMPISKPMRVQYVGEPKLCSILCCQEVDQPSPTEAPRYRPYKPRACTKNNNQMSLGILQSLVASHDKALYFDDTEMNGQRYAMCLKAFALLHMIPVHKWTRKNLDGLMQEGAELYSAGPDDNYEKMKERIGDSSELVTGQSRVYSASEQVIRRGFKLEGYEFEVELGDKYILEGKQNEVDRPTAEIYVNDIKSALKGFFKTRNYCLLSSTNLYLFLWQSDGVFFLLDFYGRDSDLELSREGGYATLICTKDIQNLEHLIAEKSNLGKKDTITLREMRLLLLIDPEGKAKMSYFTSFRDDEFVQVSNEYAYLRSRLHLSLNERDPLVLRCALPVSVAAIIASKIDHPASWDTKNLEKIICYGFYICQCCWQFCQQSKTPIDFDSFPNQLQMGQFAVSVTIVARITQGIWRCVPRWQTTELTMALENCWSNGFNSLLLTIRQQTYAIWRKNGFYYLFDPYRHRLPESETQSASLRMFATKDMFLSELNLILLQSNARTTFFIHRVVITEIRPSCGREYVPLQKPPCNYDELVETKSINEAICFREDLKHCYKELGEISDDEEEESVIESVWEESEEEVCGEEEGGLLGDMEGVESSDEDGEKKSKKKKARARVKSKAAKPKKGKSGKSRSSDDDGGAKRKKKSPKEKNIKKKSKSPRGVSSDDSIINAESRKSRSRSRSRKSVVDKSAKKRKSRSSSYQRGSLSLAQSRAEARKSKSRESKTRQSIKRKSKEREREPEKVIDKPIEKEKEKQKADEGAKGDTKKEQEKPKDDKVRKEEPQKEEIKKEEKSRAGEKPKATDASGDGRKEPRLPRVPYMNDDDEKKDSSERTPESGRFTQEKPTEYRYLEPKYDMRGKDDSGLSISYSQLQVQEEVPKVSVSEYREYRTEDIVCRPNAYPGYNPTPYNLSVAGSENGSYDSICKLLRTGFKYADRVLTMTPLGNFVVFRGKSGSKRSYYVFDGCTCHVERFRHLDLTYGTAGLICFNNLHSTISYITESRNIRDNHAKTKSQVVDEICSRYCK